MNEHVESLNQVKATVVDLAIKFGPKVFVAIAIMVAGYFAGRWVGKAMARGLRKFDLEPPVRDLQGNPRAPKDPAPAFGISVLADSSIQISVNPWVNVPDYGPAGNEINKALVETFRGKSISIPFPQYEVRMLGNAV